MIHVGATNQVDQATPFFGSSEYGAKIVIAGKFAPPSDGLRCRIGHSVVPATLLSSTSLSCTILGSVAPGSTRIAITNNGIDFVDAGNLTFLPEATVTTVDPSSGPLSGGVVIKVRGTSFSSSARPSCLFDEVAVTAEVLSDTEATCVTPAMRTSLPFLLKPILTLVAFSSFGSDFVTVRPDSAKLGPTFLFYRDPSVTSVTPSAGITNGTKMTVSLTGANLAKHGRVMPEEDGLLCRLGVNGSSSSGTVITSTEAICVVECGNYIGWRSLEISLNGGAQWTSSDMGFRCDPIPVIESIYPLIGTTDGGTPLTIRGSGFLPNALLTCRISGSDGGGMDVNTSASWISSAMIVCNTPAVRGPKSARVRVSNDRRHFSLAVPAATYKYTLPPVVRFVEPNHASVTGSDTPLVVTGTNFIDASMSSCHFEPLANETSSSVGDRRVTVPATFASSTRVSCFVPRDRLSLGPAMVTVSVNGIDFSDPGAVITIEALPEIHKVVPSRGMAGSTVTPVEVSYCGCRLQLEYVWLIYE